jgi:hypothetical protein
MSEVHLDGLIKVRNAAGLAKLLPPWPLARRTDEVCIEVKMQGDHRDRAPTERAVLRCQARQVQRLEAAGSTWDGDEHLWMVTSRVPAWLHARRRVKEVARGCYRVGPSHLPFVWIAANELPLADELVPFLIARTGKALDAFVRWVMTRRSTEWLLRVLEYLPMSSLAREDLQSYVFPKTDDPVIRARQGMIAKWALEASPEVRAEVLREGERKGARKGARTEARTALRRVLAVRGLVLSAEDDARIEGCKDLDTLRRWLDQGVVAASTAEALR